MEQTGRIYLLTFSAWTREQLVSDLRQAADGHLADLAERSAAAAPAPHRVAIVATTTDEFEASRRRMLAHLEGADAARPLGVGGTAFYGVAASRSRTACVFPGLGIKHTTLARDLDRAFPVVDAWMDTLGGGPKPTRPSQSATTRAGADADQMYLALGDVLVGDLAMWVLLRDLGLQCDALVGHSFGENAALIASGVVDDFAALMGVVSHVLSSGALDDHADRGSIGMLAVSAASRPMLESRLAADPPRAHLALDNCPQQLVVWAGVSELEAIEREARTRREVVFRLPALDRPVHTPLFPASLSSVRAAYERVVLRAPRVPVWSAVTADRFPDHADDVRGVLARQWVSTVRFREVIERLSNDGITTFLEVGPGDHLSGFNRDTLRGKGAVTIATNVERRDTLRQLNAAVAQLFVNGHDLDLRRLAAARVRPSGVAPARARVTTHTTSPSEVGSRVASEVAAVLGLASAGDLDTDAGFFDLGLGSIGCIELVDRLSRALGADLPQTLPFDHPTIALLTVAVANVLDGRTPAPVSTRPVRTAERDVIAIVGMGCRFPGGADSPEAFWRVLAEGRDVVGGVPADRWQPEWFDATDDPVVRRRASFGAFLDDIRGFDAAFFGISPREALTLDPQQRLLLEVTWEALEHAAIDPRSLAGSRTGVFVGISNADYASRLSLRERLAVGGHMGTGNMASTAAGRVSFVLGLTGPCLAVDTACSSSLAAIHLAVQSLRLGESEMAVAGGVNLLINPETTILLSHARALSPTGRCRTFDAAADGYVRGEGCGVIVLKRLADALAANDTVYAVIRGSAINHDGRTSGLTVPSGPAQQRVVRQALDDASCDPAQVGYIEAHGTGTPLGDPIEINALHGVFGESRAGRDPLRLGSVKASIGHLEASAGVASVIKVVLQHTHKELTPTLHFKTPNPVADWRNFDASVVTERAPWVAADEVASGVSSFGISGTNVHVVIAGAPVGESGQAPNAGPLVLPLSARSESALRERARQLAAYLAGRADVDLATVARTLATGRTHFTRRHAVVAASLDEAAAGLRAIADGDHRAADHPVAAAYERGDTINWPIQYRTGPRAALPTYPFERDAYWIDGTEAHAQPAATPSKTTTTTAGSSIAGRLRGADADDRPTLTADYVQQVVGGILGLPEDRPLDDAQRLCDAGLDSLMALQVAAVLKQDLDVQVSASDIVDQASVGWLVRTVMSGLDRGVGSAPASPASVTAHAPLSYGQRALWFLWRLAPESSAYNQSLPLRISANQSAAVWREAASRLVARHAMLRTRFIEEHGEPIQQVSEGPIVEWEETDTRGWPEDRLAAAMGRAHTRPFDLEARPPIRFHWFGGGDTATLLVTMHHIACDAWSLELLRRDLAAQAADVVAGRGPGVGPTGRTYHDFVRWQHTMLDGDAGAALWEYWRDALAEPRARLDLPTDRPRPAIQTYKGQSITLAISADLATALQQLAKDHGVTPFVLLLTTFLTLLHRWTRERDLVIGTPTSGRSQPEVAGIIGYFVEPVVMRAWVEEGATFAGFLAEVNRRSRAALGHADFPFPLLVERLRVDRDPSRNPIFDITFNFLSRRSAAARGDGLQLPETIELPQADGKFDLTLTVIEHEVGMQAALGFNTDLFDRSTVEHIGNAWLHMLDAVRRDPDQPIAAIPLTAAEDARPVLQGRLTDTTALRPVHLEIEAQARLSPDAIAVVAEDGRLTYAELMGAASALAADLRARGVGVDVPVGLCTPRTTSFVVGMVGILMAGGAFVPMDPDVPESLRVGMLRQAGATVLVHVADGVLVVTGVAVSAASATQVGLDHLAYVIFTSGSTGVPKGVAIEHRALANYAASMITDLSIAPRGQHAMVSTIGADLGHTVLVPSLVTGGTLHLLSARDTTERGRFASYLREHNIDYLKIVPSHLAALTDAGSPVLPRTALILGGESSGTAWATSLARASSCRVFNHYGPTETTVGVMTLAVADDHRWPSATLPLDHAVDNVSVWLLDEARRPVPAGVPGEVYVSGVALARGYINAPALTAERFVQLPDGTRAYRTGDVARYTPAGGLLLLGRDDRQVKIRGYRIELAQVEQALMAHPHVRQAVVLPDRDGADAATLIAWVVADPDSDVAALGASLAERLPAYMRPAAIAVVPTMPLTSNGKLDVAALRGRMPQPRADAGVSMARDLVELRLARIWMDVLEVAHVAPSDDFFDLGGHSLRAVRVASRIHDEFQVELPLTAFFTHRTLERLASFLRASAPDDDGRVIVTVQSGVQETPVVILFPGAGGSLLYFQDLIATLGPHVPVWGAQAVGLTGPHVVALDIPALAAIYADAIEQRGENRGPIVLVGHSFGALVAFDVARRLRARGAEVTALIVLDNAAPGVEREDPDALENRDWVRHIATRIERLYAVDLGLVKADDGASGPADADWLIDGLLRAGVLPRDTRREPFHRYVDLYRANVKAAAVFHPDHIPIDVPVVVLKAADRDAALGPGPGTADESLGWRGWSTAPVTAAVVPGTHITMLRPPAVEAVAAHVRATLASPLSETR